MDFQIGYVQPDDDSREAVARLKSGWRYPFYLLAVGIGAGTLVNLINSSFREIQTSGPAWLKALVHEPMDLIRWGTLGIFVSILIICALFALLRFLIGKTHQAMRAVGKGC